MTFNKNGFELLGLKPSETKILLAISKMGKPIAMIARHTEIPRTSLLYMLKKLEAKSFVRQIKTGKRTVWKSNIPKTIFQIKKLPGSIVY